MQLSKPENVQATEIARTTQAVLLKDWKAATATYRYTPGFSWRRSETNKPWALDLCIRRWQLSPEGDITREGTKSNRYQSDGAILAQPVAFFSNLAEHHSMRAKCGPVLPSGERRGWAERYSEKAFRTHMQPRLALVWSWAVKSITPVFLSSALQLEPYLRVE